MVAGESGVDPVVRPSDRADAQANGALALAKRLGRSPREVAADVVAAADLDGIAVPEIAGPGFINLTVDASLLTSMLGDVSTDDRLGIAADVGRRYLVDYSAPNVAKEMHIGHLRSTVIGDALVRMLGVPRPRRRPREPHRRLGTAVRDPHRAARRGRRGGGWQPRSRPRPASCTSWRRRGSPTTPSSPSGRGRASSPCSAANPRRWPCGNDSSSSARRSGRTTTPSSACCSRSTTWWGRASTRTLMPTVIERLDAAGLLTRSPTERSVVFPPGFTNRDGEPLAAHRAQQRRGVHLRHQ